MKIPLIPLPVCKQTIICSVKSLPEETIVSYIGQGDFRELYWPDQKIYPKFEDYLWEETVFELFCATSENSYEEWNFSSSGSWAHYHFDHYRSGRKNIKDPRPPKIRTVAPPNQNGFHIDVHIPIPSTIVSASLCAITKNQRGEKTYWSNYHLGEEPDFHRKDSFLVKLGSHLDPKNHSDDERQK